MVAWIFGRFAQSRKQRNTKFHTLRVEKKVVEQDLRSARSTLCESSSLQESVSAESASALSPHPSIRNDRRRAIMKHIRQHNLPAKNLPTTCIRMTESTSPREMPKLSLFYLRTGCFMQAASIAVLARAMEIKLEYLRTFQRISLPGHCVGELRGQRLQWLSLSF